MTRNKPAVPNAARRGLLLGAGLSLLPATRWAFAQPAAPAPAAKKVISVGGRPARVIDIHAHCYIPGSAKMISAADVAAQANPSETSPVARTLAISDVRLMQMDHRGIHTGILSVNQYWWYAASQPDAEKFIRFQDEGLRDIVARYPGRFYFLSSPALQHPALAAQQLEHAVKNLGARGASVGGHVNGKVPSTPEFDVFWAKAQELDVPVFMHPGGAENIVRPGGLEGRGDLGNVIGNPLETTLFASRMIFDGTLDRFPRLKLILAHGGGYLASYLGRTDVACTFRPTARCENKRQPAEYFRDQLYVDSMVFSSEGLRHLVATCGADHVIYGSDMPYNWPDTADIIANATFLPEQDRLAMLGGNLVRMLRLPA
ncbi:MAG TPA: amidohydrolase family protein [Ramlibacter sp.]|jgi:aminocarboxymuconate-semialdehyde decarboxylase|nr:amidohydrolase family protein [Ramlibacter sp.]